MDAQQTDASIAAGAHPAVCACLDATSAVAVWLTHLAICILWCHSHFVAVPNCQPCNGLIKAFNDLKAGEDQKAVREGRGQEHHMGTGYNCQH